jgi:hypothetical protein
MAKTIFVKIQEIAYSKRQFFFAVQAVDKLGHPSLAVFPKPIR